MIDNKEGRIIQVIGPVVDVVFDSVMPKLYERLEADIEGGAISLEVLSHREKGMVRCIALEPVEGLSRGSLVRATGAPVTIPVGKKTLGRVMNALGKPVDNKGEIVGDEYWAIHRAAPEFKEQSHITEIFETGIKVIDLLTPYARGGKIGLFGGAGVGKTVLILELIRNIAAIVNITSLRAKNCFIESSLPVFFGMLFVCSLPSAPFFVINRIMKGTVSIATTIAQITYVTLNVKPFASTACAYIGPNILPKPNKPCSMFTNIPDLSL